MTKTIKHLFLICILVIIPNGCHRQSSEQNVAAENDCTDIVPLMRPAKSKTAAYLDSLGFINIAEADKQYWHRLDVHSCKQLHRTSAV